MDNFHDEDLAEIYAKQAREWMKKCPFDERCPAGKLFRFLIVQQQKIERLEYELKIKNEFPDES